MLLPIRGRCPLICTLALASISLHAQKGPALAEVLKSAADYLDTFAGRLAGVAAEELYTQHDTGTGKILATRRLRSDLLFLGLAEGAVSTFRDVFERDGNAIRPRQDRLVKLFQETPGTSMAAARQLSEDSIRQYISPNISSIDDPMLALEFFRARHQARSAFKLESVKTINGVRVGLVKFTEHRHSPRVVPSLDNEPAWGRAWIDVASGAITQTEVVFSSQTFLLRSLVKYAMTPAIGAWLPVEMTQQCDISFKEAGQATHITPYNARMSLEGRATYAGYRRVAVDLSKIR